MSLLLALIGAGGGTIKDGAMTVTGASSAGLASVAIRTGAMTVDGASGAAFGSVAIRVGAITVDAYGLADFGGGAIRESAITITADSAGAFAGEVAITVPPPTGGGGWLPRRRARVPERKIRPTRLVSGRMTSGGRSSASFHATAIRPVHLDEDALIALAVALLLDD